MTTAPTFAKLAEMFPDFDQSTLPAIPAGFADDSWRNDSAPKFYCAGLSLALMIDYADPADRETGEGGRFGLNKETRINGIIEEAPSDGLIVETDDWSEVLAHILAAEFADYLALSITPDQWRQVRASNATPDYAGDTGPCASHDVCDANMVMLQAFENVTGREAVSSWETLPNGQPDGAEEAAKAVQAETDSALWNAAWAIAKRDYLTAKES